MLMRKWLTRSLSVFLILLFICPLHGTAEENNEIEDYAWIKGVNYEWYDKNGTEWERDLGYGQTVGLNCIRIWLNYNFYSSQGKSYLLRAANLINRAEQYGYKTIVIIFNGNGMTSNSHTILEDGFEPKGEAYVQDVVDTFSDLPGLLMYDVMNEPCWNDLVNKAATADSKNKWIEKHWEFVRYYCKYIKTLDPDTPITVGCTFASDLERSAAVVDVLSYHDYAETLEELRTNARLALSVSKKYGKPVLNTETGSIVRANPYDLVIQTLNEEGIPWFLYGLTIDGYYAANHGIFYPDGTVRDPAIVAAIMGIYRNRDLDTIVEPNLNWEKYATNALNHLDAAIADLVQMDRTEFAVSRVRGPKIDPVLDACEEIANLLEAGQYVSMSVPPTARIQAWREAEDLRVGDVLDFAYELAELLKEACHLP